MAKYREVAFFINDSVSFLVRIWPAFLYQKIVRLSIYWRPHQEQYYVIYLSYISPVRNYNLITQCEKLQDIVNDPPPGYAAAKITNISAGVAWISGGYSVSTIVIKYIPYHFIPQKPN